MAAAPCSEPPDGCRPAAGSGQVLQSLLPACHGGECKQRNWTVSWTEIDRRSSKKTVCASQRWWPGTGSNRRPSDFQGSGCESANPVRVRDVHRSTDRTPLNADERMRMRPKMSPPGSPLPGRDLGPWWHGRRGRTRSLHRYGATCMGQRGWWSELQYPVSASSAS
jgi:hypothetical protein